MLLKSNGLKSKMYSLISVDDGELTKENGVNKKIRQKEFADVLFNKKVIRYNMIRILSKLHRTGTYYVCKISLSYFDDKRYVLNNGVNSLAYFHKDIKKRLIIFCFHKIDKINERFMKIDKIDKTDKEFMRLIRDS